MMDSPARMSRSILPNLIKNNIIHAYSIDIEKNSSKPDPKSRSPHKLAPKNDNSKGSGYDVMNSFSKASQSNLHKSTDNNKLMN